MKLCIVTVYNSINSGSYWQAKALGMLLSNMGHEVYYLERKGGSTSIYSKIRNSVAALLRENVIGFKNKIREYSEFKKASKEFKILKNNPNSFNDIDYFILGSDTIWNLNSNYFSKERKRYFGGLFDKNKVITYAASSGNTTLETFKKYTDIPEMLERIKSISVRDDETYKIVKSLCNKNKEISLVCDPTLLLDKSEYEKKSVKPLENKYIFLYLFKSLSKNQIDELKKFAKDNNLKIISGTINFSWCDKSIVNAPVTFLNYITNAEYVITDTFHGTIFSTKLNKNFIAINRNKKKVNDFLNICNLTDRLIDQNAQICQVIKRNINYEEVNDMLKDLRNKSLKFLENALKENNT